MPEKRRKPWDVPPSGYNKAIFTHCNPFVSLKHVESAGAAGVFQGDKVGDGKLMDLQSLLTATATIVRPCFSAAKSFHEPSTEIGGRIVHGALVLDLFKVTKFRSPRPLVVPEQLVCESSSYADGSSEQLTDLCVASVEDENEEQKNHSDDSTASLEVRHEGDDPGDACGDEETRHDFKLLVQDERVTGLDKTVTVAVVECSWETASVNKLLQAAAYISKKDAFLNLEKGRYQPIFVKSWGSLNWKYGVFFLFGIVTLEAGAVSSVVSKAPRADFSKLLTDATRDLRSYLDDPSAVYPDGKYVHGLLYVPYGSYKLPDLKTEGSGDSPDTDLFFQSLIRIVCGDTALKWSLDDVRERIDARENDLNESQNRWCKRRRVKN